MFPWQRRKSGETAVGNWNHVNHFFDEDDTYHGGDFGESYYTEAELEQNFAKVSVEVPEVAKKAAEPVAKRADEGAGCISQLFFLWYVPLLRKSLKGTLEEEQLGKIAREDDPTVIWKDFEKLWNKFGESSTSWFNLLRLIFRVVGCRTTLICLMLGILRACLNIALPLISKVLIDSFQQEGDLDVFVQILLILMLSFFPFIAALCDGHLQFRGKRASMHLYEAFTIAIYNKSLVLTAAARSQTSTGQIITMMSTDASSSLQRIVVLLFPMMIAPFEIGVIVYLLYDIIGLPMVTGIVVLILALPMNVLMFGKIGKAFRKTIYVTDERIKLINELVSGIRTIKSYAWEMPFVKNISRVRNRELKYIRVHAYLFSFGVNLIFYQMPFVLMMSVMTVYYFTGGIMEPGKVFASLQLFNLLLQIMVQLPNALNQLMLAIIAMRRIQRYLGLDELSHDDEDVIDLTDAQTWGDSREVLVRIQDCIFTWNKVEEELPSSTASSKPTNEQSHRNAIMTEPVGAPVLREISLELRRGEQVAIFGATGSGKTSLLLCILGELEKVIGKMRTTGSVALSGQYPWIEHGTIRENIIFGQEYNPTWYQQVVRACDLLADFGQLQAADLTVVGERGFNLSGGQISRISLARALYRKPSILLLDQPLGSVDSHVGSFLLENAIQSSLTKNKLVVVVTNKVDILARFDRVIVMKEGRIVGNGSYEELVLRGVDFPRVQQASKRGVFAPTINSNFAVLERTSLLLRKGRRQSSLMEGSLYEGTYFEGGHSHAPESVYSARGSTRFMGGGAQQFDQYIDEEEDATEIDEMGNQLYKKEDKKGGNVGFDVYLYYLASIGYVWSFFMVFFNMAYLVAPLAHQYALTFWTNEVVCGIIASSGENSSLVGTLDCSVLYGEDFWWFVTFGIFCTGIVLCTIASIMFAEGRIRCVTRLHERLVNSVVDAPISFFDGTPVGRVLNRFLKDMNTIDVQLSITLMLTNVVVMTIITGFIGITLGTRGLFLAVLVPVFYVYYKIYSLTRQGAIQLQRIEATTRSPIYSRFAELLHGVDTVRAFNQVDRFKEGNEAAMRRNVLPLFYVRIILPSWLMISLSFLGVLISAGVALIIVLTQSVNYLSAGEAGLALTYSLSLTQNLSQIVFILTQLEVQMHSVERYKEWIEDVPAEDDTSGDNKRIAKVLSDWPRRAQIEFSNYSAGFGSGPDVLKRISLIIEDKEKIGIVGRTGSGKSTLTLSLLRMVDARGGQILIGGLDIATIPLKILRRSFGLIPQSPVCFVGTLRYNIDPFGEHSDTELWSALAKWRLRDYVRSLPGHLDYVVSEGGRNISSGQRQLMSIVRAWLRNSHVLILDEPTSNLDAETDAVLQNEVQTSFADRTILTIAHKLETVMESDRVIVLDEGKLVEFDAPSELMKLRRGHFRGLVESSRSQMAQRKKSRIRYESDSDIDDHV